MRIYWIRAPGSSCSSLRRNLAQTDAPRLLIVAGLRTGPTSVVSPQTNESVLGCCVLVAGQNEGQLMAGRRAPPPPGGPAGSNRAGTDWRAGMLDQNIFNWSTRRSAFEAWRVKTSQNWFVFFIDHFYHIYLMFSTSVRETCSSDCTSCCHGYWLPHRLLRPPLRARTHADTQITPRAHAFPRGGEGGLKLNQGPAASPEPTVLMWWRVGWSRAARRERFDSLRRNLFSYQHFIYCGWKRKHLHLYELKSKCVFLKNI